MAKKLQHETNMIPLPISDCVREHYEKHTASFTDSQRATIYWQSMLPLADKLMILKNIHDTTVDEELKVQIQKRLYFEKEMQEIFFRQENGYIYPIWLDDDRDADRVFSSVDAAMAYGKAQCYETYKIRKEILDDLIDENTEENILLCITAEFKKDGTIIDCDRCNFKEHGFVIINALEADGFEEAYIPVLNPYEYGDIVRIMGDDRPALVVTSQKHWYEHKERLKHTDLPLNYYTNSLTVEFLYPNGEFSHGHPNILYLEKIEQWEDEKEWKLLQSISALMKGEGCIEEVLECFKRNKYDKR